MTSDDRSVGKVRGVDGLRGRFEGALRDLRGRRLTSVDYWDVHNSARNARHGTMATGITPSWACNSAPTSAP